MVKGRVLRPGVAVLILGAQLGITGPSAAQPDSKHTGPSEQSESKEAGKEEAAFPNGVSFGAAYAQAPPARVVMRRAVCRSRLGIERGLCPVPKVRAWMRVSRPARR